jgi:hypothetical protein
MTKAKPSEDDRLTRKAVRIGAVIGAVLMPVFFFVAPSGPDLTGQAIMWLCINGVLSGGVVGGGLGYLLTSRYV